MTIHPSAALFAQLVKTTLDDGFREELQRELRPLKAVGDVEAAHAFLESKEIDAFTAIEVANDFCDRIFAGIDDWDEADRLRWREMCAAVMELTSSVC